MTDTRLGIAIADEAGIHDAPTVVTWTEIFNLIDAARKYERESCARICEQTGDTTGECPEMAGYCADAIRMRSNV